MNVLLIIAIIFHNVWLLNMNKHTFNKKEETILQLINQSVIINLSVVFVL